MALAIGHKSSRAKRLALDWDARTVRAVMVRPRGESIEVLRAATIPVPADLSPQDPAACGRFLSEALRQAGISARHVVIAVPRDRVVLNTLSVPPTPNDELPTVVQFQMVKELPFGAGEAVMDFSSRETDEKSPRDLLVAALRNDVLANFREVAKTAGLKLTGLGLRPEANLAAVSANAPEVARGQTLVIDIGPELTEIDIVSAGRLAFCRAAVVRLPAEFANPIAADAGMEDSRIIGMPVADIEAGHAAIQAVVDDLLIEVTRSVEAFRATSHGARIDRIVVAGATGVEQTFGDAAAERFGAEVMLFNPARAIEMTPARARELRGFSAALGLAMSDGRSSLSRIDFHVPKRTVTRRTRQIQRMRVAALAAVVFVLLGWRAFNLALAEPLARKEALAKRVAALGKVKREYEDLQTRMKSLDAWLDSERIWIDDLLKLTSVFAANDRMYVVSMLMTNATPIDLKLRTADQNVATELVRRINELGPFDAKLENSVEQLMRDRLRYTERVTVAFRGKGGPQGIRIDPALTKPPAASAPRPDADEPAVADVDPAEVTDAAETPGTTGPPVAETAPAASEPTRPAAVAPPQAATAAVVLPSATRPSMQPAHAASGGAASPASPSAAAKPAANRPAQPGMIGAPAAASQPERHRPGPPYRRDQRQARPGAENARPGGMK